MKLSPELHQSLAQSLQTSQRTRVQLELFSRLHPSMDIEDSYAIQRAWMDLCRSQGRTAIGHKIGLTSRAMQIASQITEPDFGRHADP